MSMVYPPCPRCGLADSVLQPVQSAGAQYPGGVCLQCALAIEGAPRPVQPTAGAEPLAKLTEEQRLKRSEELLKAAADSVGADAAREFQKRARMAELGMEPPKVNVPAVTAALGLPLPREDGAEGPLPAGGLDDGPDVKASNGLPVPESVRPFVKIVRKIGGDDRDVTAEPRLPLVVVNTAVVLVEKRHVNETITVRADGSDWVVTVTAQKPFHDSRRPAPDARVPVPEGATVHDLYALAVVEALDGSTAGRAALEKCDYRGFAKMVFDVTAALMEERSRRLTPVVTVS